MNTSVALDSPAAGSEAPAAVPPEPAIPLKRISPVALGVGILAAIAVVAALYLARAFFIPLLIGILAAYALRPVVDWLDRCHIPRAAGAGLVLGAIAAALAWAALTLGDDAAAMIEKLPEAAHKVRQHLGEARKGGSTALQQIQAAAAELQGAASDAAGVKIAAKKPTPALPAREPEPSVWLRDYVLAQSALLFTVIAEAPIVALLAYFLLASGEHFRKKLVQWVGPSLARKKDAVRMLEEIDGQVQRYLLVTLVSNVLIAIGTWLAFAWLGLEQAGAWGLAGGVLHFIPYLGPVAFAIASGAAGFMQFGTAIGAFMIAGASLLVAACVGFFITTWLQARFARVNPAVLFIALLFFGWLWGIWGLLLGAPILAIARVICGRVESLKPTGELLAR
jgi:predicted PurR-regulated permease PerM